MFIVFSRSIALGKELKEEKKRKRMVEAKKKRKNNCTPIKRVVKYIKKTFIHRTLISVNSIFHYYAVFFLLVSQVDRKYPLRTVDYIKYTVFSHTGHGHTVIEAKQKKVQRCIAMQITLLPSFFPIRLHVDWLNRAYSIHSSFTARMSFFFFFQNSSSSCWCASSQPNIAPFIPMLFCFQKKTSTPLFIVEVKD